MLHDYWMYVDDEPLVKETLPHTRTVLDWFAAQQRPDGLLGRMRWWEFGDWTADYSYGVPPQETDGGSAFLTLQFIEGLRNAEEMELAYGSRERAHQYAVRIRRAAAALNSQNWDAQYGLYADTPKKKSWSIEANVLAVLLDVAPRVGRAAILRRVLSSKRDAQTTVEDRAVPAMSEPTYYFRFYLSRALEHAGMADLYLQELQPWYDMLRLGLTTWAENPEPTRSDCHVEFDTELRPAHPGSGHPARRSGIQESADYASSARAASSRCVDAACPWGDPHGVSTGGRELEGNGDAARGIERGIGVGNARISPSGSDAGTSARRRGERP